MTDKGRGGELDARLEGGEGVWKRPINNGEVEPSRLFLFLSKDRVRLSIARSRDCCSSFFRDPDIAPLRLRGLPVVKLSLPALGRPESDWSLRKTVVRSSCAVGKALLW